MVLNMKNINNWYALYVKTGRELSIKKRLEDTTSDSLSFHVPIRVMRIRKQGKYIEQKNVLFPGYILVKGDLINTNYREARLIPDVYRWISSDNGPLAMSSSEAKVLETLLRDSDNIIPSEIEYVVGQDIKIISGPLKGLEANIVKLNRRKERVTVSIPFYDSNKYIDFSISIINKKD